MEKYRIETGMLNLYDSDYFTLGVLVHVVALACTCDDCLKWCHELRCYFIQLKNFLMSLFVEQS